jgi:hypothetical protein
VSRQKTLRHSGSVHNHDCDFPDLPPLTASNRHPHHVFSRRQRVEWQSPQLLDSTVGWRGDRQWPRRERHAFPRTLSELVAEERYVQVVKLWSGAPPTRGREPDLAWRPGTGAQLTTGSSGTLRRRQLLSDVLLVQAPGEVRIGYRDVAEVDGKSVRDRAVRVQKLFMSGRADDRRQLRRIAAESARHNLGTGRNFNLPTFPLEPLRASALERFIWTQQPDDVRDAECCAVVGFFEVRSPTLVRTPADHDVPVLGQLWIEPRTGRVTRAVLQFAHQVEHVEGAFDVTYGRRDGLDVLIPERLWEWYRTPDLEHLGRPAYVEGEASYGTIRRFTVTSDVTVR